MIITVKNTLVQSIRIVFHHSKVVWLMWAFNISSALVLTVPFYNLFIVNIGHSLMSERLLENFDYMWFLQFRHLYEVQLDQIPTSIYAIVVIYTLLQTFFLGGLVAIFNTPDKDHIVDFFYGGVKYFFRFVKVLLISLFFFALAFIVYDWLGELITSLLINSENVWLDFILKLMRYIFLVFMIGVVTMIGDYVKVSLAVKDRKGLFKEIYQAVLFIRDNFRNAFTLFLIVASIGAVGVIIYNVLGKFIPRTPVYFVGLSFVLQQLLIIFRLLIRMLFCASEVNLYKDLSADIVSAEIQS